MKLKQRKLILKTTNRAKWQLKWILRASVTHAKAKINNKYKENHFLTYVQYKQLS